MYPSGAGRQQGCLCQRRQALQHVAHHDHRRAAQAFALDVDAVLASCNARLGKTQRLSALHLIDEMPRSHIGKLLKTDLRELVPVKPR